MNETELKRLLTSRLTDSFHFESEVRGIHRQSGEVVIADFIATPMNPLVEDGFDLGSFPIEVKAIDWAKVDSGRLYKTFWQAHTYSESTFESPDIGKLQATFSALFVSPAPFPPPSDHRVIQLTRWTHLLELGVCANVASIRMREDDWGLYFGQGSYYTHSRGVSSIPRGTECEDRLPQNQIGRTRRWWTSGYSLRVEMTLLTTTLDPVSKWRSQ
jgi:hypothetical protein